MELTLRGQQYSMKYFRMHGVALALLANATSINNTVLMIKNENIRCRSNTILSHIPTLTRAHVRWMRSHSYPFAFWKSFAVIFALLFLGGSALAKLSFQLLQIWQLGLRLKNL